LIVDVLSPETGLLDAIDVIQSDMSIIFPIQSGIILKTTSNNQILSPSRVSEILSMIKAFTINMILH